MTPRRGSVAFLVLILAACEQSNQELPFTVAPDQPVERQVTPQQGGNLTAVATTSTGETGGISIVIPPNTIGSQTTTVTAAAVSPNTAMQQAIATQNSGGTVVSGSAFALTPEGHGLARPVNVEIQAPNVANLTGNDALRLTAVLYYNGVAETLFTPSIDLNAGMAVTTTNRLGTIALKQSADLITIEAGEPTGTGGVVTAPAIEGVSAAMAPVAFNLACEGQQCNQAIHVRAGQQFVNRYRGNLGAHNLSVTGQLVLNGDGVNYGNDSKGGMIQRGAATGQVTASFDLKAKVGKSLSSSRQTEERSLTGTYELRTGEGKFIVNGVTYNYTYNPNSGTFLLILPTTTVRIKQQSGPDETIQISAGIFLRR